MKKTILILTTVFVLGITQVNAFFDDYEPSVRARALGGAFNSLSDDANGIFYNPAGLNRSDEHLSVSYAKLFGNDFSLLKTAAFTMPLPRNYGSMGIGLQTHDVDYLDENLMSEKIYTLAHSFSLMKDVHTEFNFGYSANLYHLTLDSFGSETALGVNFGALVVLHHRTFFGFSVTNINNPKMGENNRHELPQRMAMGLTYIPYPAVKTSIELKKPFGQTTQIHSGAEVDVHEYLTLRLGVRNNPASFSGGVAISVSNIIVDYAYNSHTVLNGTHHFGIGYGF
jgi:hypothetical protein